MKKQSLVKGAFILTAAAFITRILIFTNTIIQSRILGPEGIGLKKMVMPFMGLMMTLTTIGLPVAISKLVAEADAEGNRRKVKKILIVSLTLTGSLSIVVMMFSVLSAKAFSSYFLTDQRAYYSFMALIPMIPLGAISGVVKGYFRGMQTMSPLALSQVFEQIVHIVFTYVLVQLLIPYGIEYAAAGTVFSSVIGEAFSLLFLLGVFRRTHFSKFHVPQSVLPHITKGKTILMELLQTGLPTAGSGVVMSAARSLQPIMITKSLAAAGVSSVMITKQYGMLTGFVMPLIFFPAFINQSLKVTLVPAISEANAKNNIKLIRRRINQAIGAALLVGVPSTIFLYLFSSELMTVIYHSPQAASLLKVIAPFYLFNYIQTPLQSALVGLGKAKIEMMNNIIAAAVTLLLIYPLASNPQLGIFGVIYALSIGGLLETFLHFYFVVEFIDFSLDFSNIIRILAAGTFMGCSSKIIFVLLASGFNVGYKTLISILLSLGIYLMFLVYLKVIQHSDIIRIPLIGRIWTSLFPVK
ncbi:stage V sporulation protein B [Desulfitobacterium sp. Sab5]|uniref:stage V sporulation protein B n=1 Tax=Desulfitobacterium nosdiversum TaxID=3375356 RepID=UPI003CF0D17B